MGVLDQVVKFIVDKHESLFSGLGLAVIGIVYNFFFRKKSQSSANKIKSSGNNSSNYMSEGDMTVNHGLSTEHVVELFSELSKKVGIGEKELAATRQSVKKSLMPYFKVNRQIFDTYGPMTDERFNPESEMPELWQRKIQEFILPNNEKIVALIENDQHLLLNWELEVFAKYKQHVDDFSAKHTGITRANGTTYPMEIHKILE